MLATVVLGGCAPQEDPPLPPVVWEGEAVRVRMDDPGIQVCGGSFEALDRHARLVREALLLQGDGIIDYSIGDEDFVDSICASEASDSPDACTYPGVGSVYTTIPFVQHELVHAARIKDPTIGFRSSPIEEGLATLLGGDPIGDDTVLLDAHGILREQYVTGGAEYYRAGQTMAILIERYGVQEFRRFDILARTDGEDQTFEEVFGETKDEFATYASSVPHCEQSQWWMPLLECDGAPMGPDPVMGATTLTGNLGCGEPDVQGPVFGTMWTSRHFRLDERTTNLSYRIDMPEDATLEIVACNGGCPERFAYIGTRNQVGSILNGIPALEPGEYFLRMSRPVDGDAEDGRFEIIFE